VTDEQLPLFGDGAANPRHELQADLLSAEQSAKRDRDDRRRRDGVARLLRALVKRRLAEQDLPTAAMIAVLLDEGVGR
jgi:hypothetical protein